MNQHPAVVSFPLDASNLPFLRDFTGNDRQRLNEIVARLSAMADLMCCLRSSDAVEGSPIRGVLVGLEQMVLDCVAVAELRPVEAPR